MGEGVGVANLTKARLHHAVAAHAREWARKWARARVRAAQTAQVHPGRLVHEGAGLHMAWTFWPGRERARLRPRRQDVKSAGIPPRIAITLECHCANLRLLMARIFEGRIRRAAERSQIAGCTHTTPIGVIETQRRSEVAAWCWSG